jgi:acyl-coenzyme A synthetase/AMP-(fatty) acid ligase
MIVDNSLKSHTALLAMAELGMNVAVIDSNVTTEQLRKILGNFDSAIVLVANPHMKAREFPEHNSFVPLVRDSAEGGAEPAGQSRDGSVVVFSSGSTNEPKGVVIGWGELTSWTRIRHGIAEDAAAGDLKMLNLSPVSWVLGLLNLLTVNIGARFTTLDTSQFAPSQLLTEIQRLEPSFISITVNLAQVLSNSAK